jgi:hypothetical protein
LFIAACSRFHTLPGGLKAGVQLQVGVAVEMLLGMVLNMVVLYASGEGNPQITIRSHYITLLEMHVVMHSIDSVSVRKLGWPHSNCHLQKTW